MQTTHDITANGKTYILVWTHAGDDQPATIAITETCDCPEDESGDGCDHEIYDFEEIE